MSENETLFIKEMRKTLMRIFIPIAVAMILGVGSFAVAAPFRIKANEQRTDAIERSYVSNEMMALYMNQMREANMLMRESLESHTDFDIEEFARINARMDRMIREMVPHNTRGGTPSL